MGQFGATILVYCIYFGIFVAAAASAAGVMKVLPIHNDDDRVAFVFLPLFVTFMAGLALIFSPAIHNLKSYACSNTADKRACMGEDN